MSFNLNKDINHVKIEIYLPCMLYIDFFQQFKSKNKK